jgi:hypothetical protein
MNSVAFLQLIFNGKDGKNERTKTTP